MAPSAVENGGVMHDPVERLAALLKEPAIPGGVNPPCEISAVFKGAVHDCPVARLRDTVALLLTAFVLWRRRLRHHDAHDDSLYQTNKYSCHH